MKENCCKKRVVVYGDSNTYGYRGQDGGRYAPEDRWINVAEEVAGDKFQILNQGMNGRIAYNYVPPCIEADYVCVMLGSNDLLCGFGFNAETIARLAFKVVERAKTLMDEIYPKNECKYVLIAPPRISKDILNGPWSTSYEGPQTIEISMELSDCFKKVAEEEGVMFFDAAPYSETCRDDGIHLTKAGHKHLGEAFGRFLLELDKESK
ncbi:MAG: hypothetical protein IKT62_06340 [Firmicutes bacterium]|nr:hypothetical protein [Bacillota bacterium]